MHDIIKARMEKYHAVWEDCGKEFNSDWGIVAAEVQSQMLSWAPACMTPRIQSQSPHNLFLGALAGATCNGIDSQETVMSVHFTQMATPLLSILDSNQQTLDGSQEVVIGLTFGNTVTPTTL